MSSKENSTFSFPYPKMMPNRVQELMTISNLFKPSEFRNHPMEYAQNRHKERKTV